MRNVAISIRLAGGIGDHLLGMRTLSLAHARLPDRPIIVYSDCANHPVPLRIATMSPFVSEVIPVNGANGGNGADDTWIDASGDDLFATTAVALQMPMFEFLAARPALTLPAWATAEADRFLERFPASSFVGVCFAGDDPETLRQFQPRILEAIGMALGSPEAMALNFFTTRYSFAHRPEADRARLEDAVTQSADVLAGLSTVDSRVVPCADLPIEVVAALLARCRYFVGGDNGIKHLAWTLDIPRTFFVKARPLRLEIMRWMPDVHRMLSFDCPDVQLRRHLL